MMNISGPRISKFLLVAAGLLLFAWAGAAQQNPKPLTNADVIKMVSNAVPVSVIVSAIQANQTNFDISADGLIALQKASVPQKIMDAIVKAESNKKITAVPGTPTNTAAAPEQPASAASAAGPPPLAAPGPVPGQLSVIYEQGDSRQEIAVERTQMAETKTRPASMTSLASDSTLGQTLQVGMHAVITEAAKQRRFRDRKHDALSNRFNLDGRVGQTETDGHLRLGGARSELGECFTDKYPRRRSR